jgi:hypothetical protein
MIIHTLKILIEYEDADVTASWFCFPFTFYISNKESQMNKELVHVGVTNYLSNTVVVDSIHIIYMRKDTLQHRLHLKVVPSHRSALDSLQVLVEPRTRLSSQMV